MTALVTSLIKELLLLSRDRTGLLILFVMPAILVTVITLVQENVLELSGQRPTDLLVVDHDQGEFADLVKSYLQNAKLKLVPWPTENAEGLRHSVATGKYQAGIILPAGISNKVREKIAAQYDAASDADQQNQILAAIDAFFDPAALAGFRAGILTRLQMAVRAAELEMKVNQLGVTLGTKLPPQLVASGFLPNPAHLQQSFAASYAIVHEQPTGRTSATLEDVLNPVNQNVPAWALFGMFFTAIPIAGTMLGERASGISRRLAGMPVSRLALLGGRIAAYLLICLSQFALIVMIGMYLFPHLGLPAFVLPDNPVPVAVIILASGLAACSFGSFLGAMCRSYEQASTLGASLVVIAAAMGGVMVPVYAMPHLMQQLSICSPLNWGVTLFADLLTRHQNLSLFDGNLIRLIVFSMVMIVLSLKRTDRV